MLANVHSQEKQSLLQRHLLNKIKSPRPIEDNGKLKKVVHAKEEGNSGNKEFRICKECNNRTLKTENGCDICMDPDCGYSKCDK